MTQESVTVFLILTVISCFTKLGSGSSLGDILDLYKSDENQCAALEQADADIITKDVFASFGFEPKDGVIWTHETEERFLNLKHESKTPPAKIILVPHSHTDPGWWRTFEEYFYTDVKTILDITVKKMPELPNMTFAWSEICFLDMWWKQADENQKQTFKNLVTTGRLEIMTGGWVMTDEANSHFYAILDQLIEGHQWVKTNLGATPKSGWSIDPFGHGSTVPYLLATSGLEGTIIQRIHYSWKQWFAKYRAGDFIWKPQWKTPTSRSKSILTHHMPFEIYSIRHSCGPYPKLCIYFDFRKVGQITDYSAIAEFITSENVAAKADLLMASHSRTASLLTHNVAMAFIGDDFRYNFEIEFDQQHDNYKKMMDFVNENSATRYGNATIQFGTPADYFEEIRKRQKDFPTLIGDFQPYGDTFTDGYPAHWTGYFTTRPYHKLMGRELEHNLRSAEILFSIGFNKARQGKHKTQTKIFDKNYEKLVQARQNLGIFQHHDAITGTSKVKVMEDYLQKLHTSIRDTVSLQQKIIGNLIQPGERMKVTSDLDRRDHNQPAVKIPIDVSPTKSAQVVLFNSLAQERLEIIKLRILSPNVKVLDSTGSEVPYQIGPVFRKIKKSKTGAVKFLVSNEEFELMFLARLAGLSLSTFTVNYNSDRAATSNKTARIFCDDCSHAGIPSTFIIKPLRKDDFLLQNSKLQIIFDGDSGFLKSIAKRRHKKQSPLGVKFGAYSSVKERSGAYLLKTETKETKTSEKDLFADYRENQILITTGPIASDVSVIHGALLAHTVRIFKTRTHLDSAMFIENDVDFESPPKNLETEMFMRFVTAIENGDDPEVFTDLNGFQWQQRKKSPEIGIEGNYFPITTSAFIQDTQMRLTVMTTHAQGAASLEPGHLEVMLDRRTLYDDNRGMGEGVVDSRLMRHQFWVTMEFFETENSQENKKLLHVPSLHAQHLSNALNYPVNIYFVENYDETQTLQLNRNVHLLNYQLPCDLHIVNLRTLTERNLPLFPSRSALLVVQRIGYDCRLSAGSDSDDNIESYASKCAGIKGKFKSLRLFSGVEVDGVQQTSLTGLQALSHLISFDDGGKIEPMELRTYNMTFM